MRVLAVISLKADHRLTDLLDAAGLARSTFFYHQARLAAPDPQAELKAVITEVFITNHGRYGHRRVHGELTKAGWQIAKKTVLKLMRELGLVCRVRRRRRYTSYQGQVGPIAENVLNRDFTATGPNQKWVTDVRDRPLWQRPQAGDDRITPIPRPGQLLSWSSLGQNTHAMSTTAHIPIGTPGQNLIADPSMKLCTPQMPTISTEPPSQYCHSLSHSRRSSLLRSSLAVEAGSKGGKSTSVAVTWSIDRALLTSSIRSLYSSPSKAPLVKASVR